MFPLLIYTKRQIFSYRYTSSFMLSFLIYLLLVWSLFYLNASDSSTIETQTKEPSKLQISLVSFNIPKPITQPLPPVEQKIIPKKTIIQKPKIVKEVMVQEPIKEVVMDEKIIQEDVQSEEMTQEVVQQEVVQNAVFQEDSLTQPVTKNENPDQRVLSKEELRIKQELFLEHMRNAIDKNKVYPNSARRRAIEGEVQISFFLQADGDVKDIELVFGKSIFKGSAIEAITKSFPLQVEKELFSFPKKFYITLAYSLKS